MKPAASALEIIPYEMRSKLSYPLPEIWKIYEEEEDSRASATLKALRLAGVKALLISTEELGKVPPPFTATSFSLAERAVAAKNKSQETLVLPWDSIRLILLLQRVSEEKQTGGSKTESQEPGAAGKLAAGVGNLLIPGLGSMVMSVRKRAGVRLKTSLGAGTAETAVERILDVYAEADGKWVRLRLAQNALDYSGLGEARGGGSQENWLNLLSLLKERVPERLWDEGCLKMRPRPMVVEGAPFQRLLQGKIPDEISKSYPEFYSAARWISRTLA